MMSKPEVTRDKVREHEFDGIVELDNDLPRWWVLLFIVTIIFAAGYLAWYHIPLFPSVSLAEHYEKDAQAAKAQTVAAAEAAATAGAFDYAAAIKDEPFVAAGKESYVAYCTACHGSAGEGLVGPNLTDDFWIHGATYEMVEKTVTKGILEKGMPPWGEVLGVEKVHQVVAFVRTLKHTNPAGAKAPQGDPGELP